MWRRRLTTLLAFLTEILMFRGRQAAIFYFFGSVFQGKTLSCEYNGCAGVTVYASFRGILTLNPPI